MPLYRTQAVIATTDNVSANYATNSYYVSAPDLTELEGWHAALSAFYLAIDQFFSNMVRVSNGLTLKSYDMADPEPRAPLLEDSYNLTISNSDPLPAEVSLVLSFQALQESGVPQARRRGRVYLPFMQSSQNLPAGRPSTTLINGVIDAASDLVDAGKDDPYFDWAVFSTVDQDFGLVNNGWVDNEWDTQRRRGRDATFRTTFVITP